MLHGRGFALDMPLFYSRAVNALNDDFEEVRLEAVKVIWYFIPLLSFLWMHNTRPRVPTTAVVDMVFQDFEQHAYRRGSHCRKLCRETSTRRRWVYENLQHGYGSFYDCEASGMIPSPYGEVGIKREVLAAGETLSSLLSIYLSCQSCKLLGSIRDVKTSYLLQTLSKQVLQRKQGKLLFFHKVLPFNLPSCFSV